MNTWRNPCPVCGARQPPCPPSCGFHPTCGCHDPAVFGHGEWCPLGCRQTTTANMGGEPMGFRWVPDWLPAEPRGAAA